MQSFTLVLLISLSIAIPVQTNSLKVDGYHAAGNVAIAASITGNAGTGESFNVFSASHNENTGGNSTITTSIFVNTAKDGRQTNQQDLNRNAATGDLNLSAQTAKNTATLGQTNIINLNGNAADQAGKNEITIGGNAAKGEQKNVASAVDNRAQSSQTNSAIVFETTATRAQVNTATIGNSTTHGSQANNALIKSNTGVGTQTNTRVISGTASGSGETINSGGVVSNIRLPA